MGKRFYRFYGGFLAAQERWLNRMAQKGYRLIRSEKLLYEFEECGPGQYQYRIEFVGHKSKENAADYKSFLEEMGYRVFWKNGNLNYSVGKIRYRPWAEKGGRLATNATTFNRELLIVEKEADGKPFELHTAYADKADYYRSLRAPWLCIALVFGMLGAANTSLPCGIAALAAGVPTVLYQAQILRLKRELENYE